MPLRFKLLLILLLAAVFPVAGFRFIEQMEATLRLANEQALLASGQAIGKALLVMDPKLAAEGRERLYAREINFALSVDGYVGDWRELEDLAREYQDRDRQLTLRVFLARDPHWLYLRADVRDRSPVPPEGDDAALERADRVEILTDQYRLLLACERQGPARLAGLPRGMNAGLAACDRDPNGYRIELRMPTSWALSRLGIAAIDVPVPGADLPRALIGTVQNGRVVSVPLQGTGVQLPGLIALLPEGTRARVISPDRYVLAQAGVLYEAAQQAQRETFQRWLRATVYRLMLAPAFTDPAPYRGDLLRLETTETEAALRGESAVGWRPASTQHSVVLSAAVPLGGKGEFGALLLERTSDTLLLWTNRGLGGLLLGGLITVLIASAVLFGYAGYLSYRIRRLRTAAETALSSDGKLRGRFPRSKAHDDVGELSRAFARLLDQIGEYNEYLRSLASKLSHELATPLAMVKGSLDNLELLHLPEQARTYSERARSGVERLGYILRAMSEANRIERAIDQAEAERFDLRAFVTGAVAAYRDLPAARNKRIECLVPEQAVMLMGAPELLHQALDKLVDNALSFTPEQGWIRIELRMVEQIPRLSVRNQGPPLPSRMQEQLFQSMVSVRERGDNTPHLGLGLFIVRLVSELHGGLPQAGNLPNGEGVYFELHLPGML